MLVFLLSAAAILFAPGPTNALLCVVGASRGIGASVRFVIGATLAYIVSISGLRIGGSGVFNSIPGMGDAVRLLIAAYIAFLAAQVWRASAAPRPDVETPVTLRQMVVATLLNPKCFIFAFAVFPEHTSAPQEAAYMGAFTLIATAGTLSWASIGATIGKATHGRARMIFYRFAASVLGVLAAFILASIF